MGFPYIYEFETDFKSSVLKQKTQTYIVNRNPELLASIFKRLPIINILVMDIIFRMQNSSSVITNSIQFTDDEIEKLYYQDHPLKRICDRYEEFKLPELDFDIRTNDAFLRSYLADYLFYIDNLYEAGIFPKFQEWLKKLSEDIGKTSFIIKSSPNQREEYTWENSGYYLTPNGYVYRAPGISHYNNADILLFLQYLIDELKPKENNLQPYTNLHKKVGKVANKKLKTVTLSKKVFKLPSNIRIHRLSNIQILTPLNIEELTAEEKNILSTPFHVLESRDVMKKIKKVKAEKRVSKIDFSLFYWLEFPSIVEDGFIYDSTAVSLYLGHLYAKKAVLDIFNEIHKSINPYKMYSDITNYLSKTSFKDLYEEFLIRVCGFHKITESENGKKRIVTSSLNAVELFKEYLDRGWSVEIWPPIILNNSSVKEREPNNSIAFLRTVSDYNGPGYIIISSGKGAPGNESHTLRMFPTYNKNNNT